MVLDGIKWYWMVLDGSGGYLMVLDRIGWYCMVLFVWYYMASNGFKIFLNCVELICNGIIRLINKSVN